MAKDETSCCVTCGAEIRDRLVGLVGKASASRAEDLGFESCLRRGSSESYQ